MCVHGQGGGRGSSKGGQDSAPPAGAHTGREREGERERRERVRGERQWGRRQKGSGVVVAAGRGREREPGRETRPMYEYT